MFTWSVVVPSALVPVNVGNGSTNFGIVLPLSGVWPKVTDARLGVGRSARSRESAMPHPIMARIDAQTDTEPNRNR
jgi:hypothetical protein